MAKKYIEYIDRDGFGNERIVSGQFEVIEETSNYVKIKTKKNFIKIPYWQILKIKEKI